MVGEMTLPVRDSLGSITCYASRASLNGIRQERARVQVRGHAPSEMDTKAAFDGPGLTGVFVVRRALPVRPR